MFYRNSPAAYHLNDFRSSRINKYLQDEFILEQFFLIENPRFSFGKRSVLVPRTCRFSAHATQLSTQLQPTPMQDTQDSPTHVDSMPNETSGHIQRPFQRLKSPAFAESPSCGGGWLVTRHVGRLTTTWPRGGRGAARRAILRNTSTNDAAQLLVFHLGYWIRWCALRRGNFGPGRDLPCWLAALEHERNFVCVMSFGSRITIHRHHRRSGRKSNTGLHRQLLP